MNIEHLINKMVCVIYEANDFYASVEGQLHEHPCGDGTMLVMNHEGTGQLYFQTHQAYKVDPHLNYRCEATIYVRSDDYVAPVF